MKKIIETVKQKKWIHYIIITIIGLLVAIPFFWVQLRETDDGYVHILRVISMGLSLENGSFPYILTPFFCRNFGYTMTLFYGPFVTHLPYLLSLIVKSPTIAIKIFSALTIPVSGIFMYNFVYEVTKKKGISFLSAVLYMIFPYRLEVYFNRFAMGEFTALIFIPVVFQGLYNLLHGDKRKHFYITIGGVGLMLTHTISTTYTALFCLIYILFNLKAFFKKDVVIKCVINAVFILLISAFFLIPILESESVSHYTVFDPSRMRTSTEWVQKSTIEPWEFIKEKDIENPVSFVLGIPTVIMLAISILAYRYIDKKYKRFYLVSLLLGFISFWMCTNFFPWKLMPQLLTNIQYPWRLVGFGMFFFIPVMAMNVYYLFQLVKKDWTRNIGYMLAILLLAIFTVKELSIYKVVNPNEDKEYEQRVKASPIISHFSVNREYLPYSANVKQKGYLAEREDRVYVLSGKATAENQKKYAFDFSVTIKYGEKDTVLELPYLFYPGYTATLEMNGVRTNLEITESKNGFLQVTLPTDIEEGTIITDYTGTVFEKLAYVISAVSVVLFIQYILYFRQKLSYEEKNERKD